MRNPSRNANAWLYGAATLICFVLARPYTGIWHDAILYTTQALYRLHPEHYRNDLFFLFGSQDNLSIYGAAYGKIVAWLGINRANLVCLLLSQTLWLTGALRLSQKLLPARLHWFGLLLIAAMPRSYGAGNIFSYGEPFLTARLPAEALGLWSIAMILGHRRMLAASLSALAILIHPIIGIIPATLVLFLATPAWRWWLMGSSGLLFLLILEELGIAFLDFDPLWLEMTRLKSSYLFVSLWGLPTWSQACWVIALPIIIRTQFPDLHKSLWDKIALLGIAGMALAILADYVAHDVLLIQVQSWRVLWLLSALQWLAVASLIHSCWPERRMQLCLLACCWFFLEQGGGLVTLTAALAAPFFARIRPQGYFQIPTHLDKYVNWLAYLILVTAFASWLAASLADIPTAGVNIIKTTTFSLQWLEGLIHTRMALFLVVTIYLLGSQSNIAAKIALNLLLLFLAVYALLNLDQRPQQEAFLETNFDQPSAAPFSNIVKPGSMVYWQGDLRFPWHLMKTAHYFSLKQTAGSVFRRETAIEALRRSARLAGRALPEQSTTPQSPPASLGNLIHLKEPGFSDMSPQRLHFLCQDPVMDYAILGHHYPAWAIAEYHPATLKLQLWLYDCRSLRQTLAPTVAQNAE